MEDSQIKQTRKILFHQMEIAEEKLESIEENIAKGESEVTLYLRKSISSFITFQATSLASSYSNGILFANLYKFIPGARMRIVVTNLHTRVSGYAHFECPYSEYKLEYAIKVVTCCWEFLAKVIRNMFHAPEVVGTLLTPLEDLVEAVKTTEEEKRGRRT